MDLEALLKLLASLGLSPFEVITVIALIIVYRKNDDLWNELLHLRDSLDECLGKIPKRTNEKSPPYSE